MSKQRLIDANALDRRIYNKIPVAVFGSRKKMEAVREIIGQEPTALEWISVKDKLPQMGDLVVIVDDLGFVRVASFADGRLFNEKEPWFYVDGEYEPCVVYWMMIPEIPEMQENADADN